MVLHELDQRRDRLAAEVLEVAAGERVRLVDEQHAADGAVDDFRDLEGRLADVARDEVRARRLDEVPRADDAEVAVQPADDPCDRRLARAGRSGEDQVVGRVDLGQAGRPGAPR